MTLRPIGAALLVIATILGWSGAARAHGIIGVVLVPDQQQVITSDKAAPSINTQFQTITQQRADARAQQHAQQ
ncbi:MAG: hypothetical protein AAGA39_10250 [Pseudomonadota bacterium]